MIFEEFISKTGKTIKSRVMHLTETQAGWLFVSVVSLSVLIAALLVF
jgi:hypothetical protein